MNEYERALTQLTHHDSHLFKQRGHMELTCHLKPDMCRESNLNTE